MLIVTKLSFVEFCVEISLPYHVAIYEYGECYEPVKSVKFWTKKGAVAYAKRITSHWTEHEGMEFDWFVYKRDELVDAGSSLIQLVRTVVQVPYRNR